MYKEDVAESNEPCVASPWREDKGSWKRIKSVLKLANFWELVEDGCYRRRV